MPMTMNDWHLKCALLYVILCIQIASTCAHKPSPSPGPGPGPSPGPSQNCCSPGHPYHFIKGSHCVETSECHFEDIQIPGRCPAKFNFINRVDHIRKCRVDCSENIKYCPENDIVNVTMTTKGEQWWSNKSTALVYTTAPNLVGAFECIFMFCL